MRWTSETFYLALGVLLILSACSDRSDRYGKDDKWPLTPKGGAVPKGELVKAVARDEYDQVLALLEKGADINENVGTESKEITPLLTAVIFGRERIAFLLLDRGAATHFAYNRYTARDFERYLHGDSKPLLRSLIQREILKTSRSHE